MHICIATPEYTSSGRVPGGIAAQYEALAQGLVEMGERVTVLVGAPPPSDQPYTEVSGVTLRVVDVGFRSGPLSLLVRSAAAAAVVSRMKDCDIILAAEWTGLGAIATAGSTPVVTHLHTSLDIFHRISGRRSPWEGRISPRARLQVGLERSQGRRSNALIGCSGAILRWTQVLWGIDEIRGYSLPNIVDVAALQDSAAGGSDTGVRGAPLIVVPGRVETRKGVGTLMRAMPAVWGRYPDAVVAFAGDLGVVEGSPGAEFIFRSAGPKARNVRIMGSLDRQELASLLNAADVVVTPSLWEAFGIVTLEAMALGKRVVATEGSGFSEYCRSGDNSILVPPGVVDGLAGGIIDALQPERASLENAARQTASEFSRERVAVGFRDTLLEVLGG